MKRKPKAPSTVAKSARGSLELDQIEGMLKVASEYKLEAEVVWALCDTIKMDPDISLEDATFQALAEWDL